ncbi:hypothetical protein I4U23_012180 [Adineta vaga]|nr:hypothetical protein I4U23_012180 [Adineta vaga]
MSSNTSVGPARKNNHRLLSSVRSAVTPKRHDSPTVARVTRMSVRRDSTKRHKRHRAANSSKSSTIIHTSIRPIKTTNKTTNVIPLIADRANIRNNRHDLFPSASANYNPSQNQLSNQWTNNKQHSTNNTNLINDSASHSSIVFNSSSQIQIIDDRHESLGDFRDVIEKVGKRKRRRKLCCFSYPCLICLVLVALIVGTLLATLLLAFLTKTSETTTKATSNSISSTTTSTSTTAQVICNFSCENQLWISSSNLLANWDFNNDLYENVSNSIAASTAKLIYSVGYIDQALTFVANNNQTLTSSVMSLASISFTVTAWIYPTGFPNTKDHSIVGLCPNALSYECLHIVIRKNSGNCYLYFGFYAADCQGNAIIPINEWIHVAFVFDVSTLTQSIYINGKLDATKTIASSFKGNPDSVTIGNIPGIDLTSGRNNFQGSIDRITINDRAKSSCEILQEATLAAYFTFNPAMSLIDSGPNSLAAAAQSVSSVSNGHSQQAISLTSSTSSYFQIAGVSNLGINNRPFSISFWVRPRTLSGTLVHVSDMATGLGWCLPFIGFATNGSIVAQMLNSAVRSVIGPSIPLAPTWTHIVETWHPTNGLRLYINNALVASTNVLVNAYTASSTPAYITWK